MTTHDQPSPPNDRDDDKDDDEIEIVLRHPAEVAARLILLASLARRAFLEGSPATRAEADTAGDRFDLAAWLEAERLLPFATAEERHLLLAAAAAWTADIVAEQTWRAEGLVVLAWALALANALPLPHALADPSSLPTTIPEPWDSTTAFRQAAHLRAESVIAVERERAELWHWRAETASLAPTASPAERRDLAAAIADVATEGHRAGLLPPPLANDFPVADRPFAALPPASLDDLAIATFERLRALDWLCGLLPTWDTPPTITGPTPTPTSDD